MRRPHNISGSDVFAREQVPLAHGAIKIAPWQRRRGMNPVGLLGVVGIAVAVAVGVTLKVVG